MIRNEIFSIRQMIELTGLSEFTIRGWENRYEAFRPCRSDTGRREYSKKDVERALLLRELLKRRHKISKIAKLKNSQLLALFEETEVERHDGLMNHRNQIVREAMELLALQKWSELAQAFKKVQIKKARFLINDFFLPLLSELAQQMSLGTVSIAQEHVISSLLKEKIYFALSHLESQKGKKPFQKKIRFVLAAPEGDHHEIGLLMAHLMIRCYGLNSLFIGPHTPVQDLAETTLRYEASHLLLVSTLSKQQGARQDILSYVSALQKKMGPQLQIIVSGDQAPLISTEKKSLLLSINSFADLDRYLQTLGGLS